MPHNRWVVVPEEAFLHQSGLFSPDAVTEAPLPDPLPTETLDKEIRPTPEPESPKQGKGRNLIQVVANDQSKWLHQLPSSFQTDGFRLLAILEKHDNFSYKPDGTITINGHPVQGYDLSQFLQTACVPFHKGQLPPAVHDFLRDSGITRLRNHLVKIRPKWIKRYAWKPSTMETRQGLSRQTP